MFNRYLYYNNLCICIIINIWWLPPLPAIGRDRHYATVRQCRYLVRRWLLVENLLCFDKSKKEIVFYFLKLFKLQNKRYLGNKDLLCNRVLKQQKYNSYKVLDTRINLTQIWVSYRGGCVVLHRCFLEITMKLAILNKNKWIWLINISDYGGLGFVQRGNRKMGDELTKKRCNQWFWIRYGLRRSMITHLKYSDELILLCDGELNQYGHRESNIRTSATNKSFTQPSSSQKTTAKQSYKPIWFPTLLWKKQLWYSGHKCWGKGGNFFLISVH